MTLRKMAGRFAPGNSLLLRENPTIYPGLMVGILPRPGLGTLLFLKFFIHRFHRHQWTPKTQRRRYTHRPGGVPWDWLHCINGAPVFGMQPPRWSLLLTRSAFALAGSVFSRPLGVPVFEETVTFQNEIKFQIDVALREACAAAAWRKRPNQQIPAWPTFATKRCAEFRSAVGDRMSSRNYSESLETEQTHTYYAAV